MELKKTLPHFHISSSLGGQQEWYSRFTDFGMNVGGCAAVTACDCAIVLEKYFGVRGLYPYNLNNITREDYLRFGKIMEPYLYPRWSGVDKLEIYLEGFGRFLKDRGADVKLEGWSGDNDIDKTWQVLREQIDAGYPVPCLTLNHKEPTLSDYVWHWFILNGYEVRGDKELVQAVSYGVGRWFDFATFWDTGYQRKGGLIIIGL